MSPDINDAVFEEQNTGIPEETRSVQTQGSLIGSFSASINYPYPTLLKDTSFPRFHLTPGRRSPAEVFNGSLSMLGHGSPLWEPIGDLDRPKKHLTSGISIGDVGFLNSSGDFETYFNIFLSPEDPAQHYCPPDLVPLDSPLESEISVNPMQFPPGTTLVSNGIEVSTLSSTPLDVQFTVNGREGGILVLPDGALREDLLSTTRIRPYVQKHALNWYAFVKKLLNDEVVHPNGTLYVVTGTDKATTWATCVTHTRKSRIHQLWKPPTITYRGAREDAVHHWESNQMIDEQLAYQRSRPIEHVGKCALFVRGMRIAVNVRDWTKHLLHYKIPDVVQFNVVCTLPILGPRAKFQTLKECRPGFTQVVPSEGGIGIRIIFHPLDVILRLLLEESPSSSIAYIEDRIWCLVADKSDGSLASIVRLLVQILETHETSMEDGMITLLPRMNPQKQVASTSSSMWLQLPTYIRCRYRLRSQRRETLSRLAKVFPGPGVPPDFLESTH